MSTWDDICGEHELKAIRTDVRHPFNSDANGCALGIDDMTVFVFEDPNDGYRSSAAEPLISKAPLYSFGGDPEYIRVPALIRRWTKGKSSYSDGSDGIEIIDRRNGKTILLLGTDNLNHCYPCFTCEWTPTNIADNAGK